MSGAAGGEPVPALPGALGAPDGADRHDAISPALICAKFIHVALSKVMIRHSIQAASRISARPTRSAAQTRRHDAEPCRRIARLGAGLDSPRRDARDRRSG
jgi:hypothetical protein